MQITCGKIKKNRFESKIYFYCKEEYFIDFCLHISYGYSFDMKVPQNF